MTRKNMGTNTKECVESNKAEEKTEKKDMEGSREEARNQRDRQRGGNCLLGTENKTSFVWLYQLWLHATSGQITITRGMAGSHLEIQMGWISE